MEVRKETYRPDPTLWLWEGEEETSRVTAENHETVPFSSQGGGGGALHQLLMRPSWGAAPRQSKSHPWAGL